LFAQFSGLVPIGSDWPESKHVKEAENWKNSVKMEEKRSSEHWDNAIFE
jgi:hypothetical protein